MKKISRNRRGSAVALWLGGVSAIALGGLAAGAYADPQAAAKATPSASDNGDTTVVVTAIRRSLKTSQQIKKDSDVIVDSITADDIGALPDRSVTEALQRVPGVAINRFQAVTDPDHFSVEGSGVTVRGLNMTRSELNGRDTFSANNGRALSFADVPAELMGGVDVFKNPDASMIEGGVAGTVNLRTRLPFDSKKQILSFSAEDSYGDFVKKSDPTFSGLYSNQWHTSIGDLGLLVDLTDSKLTTRSDGLQVANYACRHNIVTYPNGGTTGTPITPTTCTDSNGVTGPGVYFPRGADMRSQITSRERKGYALAAQWRSNDGKELATLQFLRSDATQAWTEHAIEIATDNVTSSTLVDGTPLDSFPVYGTAVTTDNNGIFTSGTLSGGYTGWRGDNRSPAFGLQSNDIYRNQQQEFVTQDTSFNFKWNPNDKWAFKFDMQHVDSSVDITDNTIWGSVVQDVAIQLNGNNFPTINFTAPTNQQTGSGKSCPTTCTNGQTSNGTYDTGAHNTLSDPYNNWWRSAMDHWERSDGQENSLRADGEYSFGDNNWVKSVDFGVRWSMREQTTRFSTYNWGVLSETWGGSGPVYMDQTLTAGPDAGKTSASVIGAFAFDNFMQGKTNNPTTQSGARLFYTGNAVTNYPDYVAFAQSVIASWGGHGALATCPNSGGSTYSYSGTGWVPIPDRCGVNTDPNSKDYGFLPQEINPVKEVNNAAYLMLNFRHDLEGDAGTITGNFGLRYTDTKRFSQGYQAYPISGSYPTDATCTTQAAQAAAQTPPQTVTGFCALGASDKANLRAWSNGAISPINSGIRYNYLLPSFNLRYAPRKDLVLRAALTETLTPPDVGLVRAYYNLAAPTVVAGSPPVIQTSVNQVVVGNPQLKPTTSNNVDLSGEWYFVPNGVGSLTLALFHKDLHGVLTNGSGIVAFTNAGVTYNLLVTQPQNAKDVGHVDGFELAYQQTYDFLPGAFGGLGINANYARINSQGVKQSTLSNTDPSAGAGTTSLYDTSKLPLQGLSKDNANFEVFYEKYGISARLAYNYRSDFVITVRDVIVPYQPIVQAADGQLDGSLFYQLTPQVKIGIQAVNLNDNVVKTKAVISTDGSKPLEAGRSWFMNDRRFTFIVRGTF